MDKFQFVYHRNTNQTAEKTTEMIIYSFISFRVRDTKLKLLTLLDLC